MASVFTNKDLYRGGRPRSSDIQQDGIGDCFFVATAGAIADRQPDLIRIAYDAATTEFTVSLFKDGKRVEYPVTQAELRENFKLGGGSTYDNRHSGAIWPAVLEVAYAKSLDSDPTDGLKEGWKKLDQGGRAIDAMYALTGSRGESIDQPAAYQLGTQQTLQQLEDALAQGRPITLSTQNERGSKKDGLMNFHTYMVEDAYLDSKGDARLKLRNPLGTNVSNREGVERPSVKLDDLIRSGGLAYFNIGPGPAVQAPSDDFTDAIGKQSESSRQVADLLHDMARAIDSPNREAALADPLRALRDSAAGKEFTVQGKREVELNAAPTLDDGLRVTPRMSEARTQRLGM